jgi:F-type H+-transporting ATPase subunit alpha
VEVLKQPQYAPMPVAKQIAIIYAVTSGALDDVDVDAIHTWETEFHEFLDAKHADLLAEINEKKTLDDSLTERLKAAIDEFKSLR